MVADIFFAGVTSYSYSYRAIAQPLFSESRRPIATAIADDSSTVCYKSRTTENI